MRLWVLSQTNVPVIIIIIIIIIMSPILPLLKHERADGVVAGRDLSITFWTHQLSISGRGWRSCLTQCRTVTEVKHSRVRSGVGWVTAQVIDQ